MTDAKKIDDYRDTVEALARTPSKGKKLRDLEGKAAKLGLEIQGEESKAPPKQPAPRDGNLKAPGFNKRRP